MVLDGTNSAREEDDATLTVRSSIRPRNSLTEASSYLRLKGSLPPKMLLPRGRGSQSPGAGAGWPPTSSQIRRPCVSFRKMDPTTKVRAATVIGYHRPA